MYHQHISNSDQWSCKADFHYQVSDVVVFYASKGTRVEQVGIIQSFDFQKTSGRPDMCFYKILDIESNLKFYLNHGFILGQIIHLGNFESSQTI